MMKSSEATKGVTVPDPKQATMNNGEELVIPVLREEVEVHKELRRTGTVRVSKTIREREEVVQETLVSETVAVERVPVDQIVDRPPQIRMEGDITIIPVTKEELIVTKRWRVVEELRLTKRRSVSDYRENVTIHAEEVTVERVNPEILNETSKGQG
jgi:stress response protein YsnF